MSQFTQGQRVKLVGYGAYTFRADGKAGLGDVMGTVTLSDPARNDSAGYGTLVKVDDEFIDREEYPVYIDWQSGTQFDFSFDKDGRYIIGEDVVLQAVE